MSTQHLPGPWFVAETDDNDGYPETVIRGIDGAAGVAVAIDFAKIPGMRDANARLIAAAPDLLSALRELMDAISYAQDRESLMSAIKRGHDMGRLAIAKATVAQKVTS